MIKKLMICSAVSTEYRRVTDRRTDRQTSCDGILCAMHTRRVAKMRPSTGTRVSPGARSENVNLIRFIFFIRHYYLLHQRQLEEVT